MKQQTKKKTAQKPIFTKDFHKGVIPDLIIAVIGIGVILWALLAVPFSADGYDDRAGFAVFTAMIAIGVATALFTRSLAVTMSRVKTKTKVDEAAATVMAKQLIVAGAFIVAAFLIQLPWIFAGAFNDDQTGTGATFFLLMLFDVIGLPLLGILAAAFIIFPIESTIRGTIRLIRTRGKEKVQLIIGLFGLMILSLIASGVLAVDPDNSGPVGQGQIILALLGLPGGYEVINEPLLWLTRLLFVAFIGLLLIGRFIGRRAIDQGAIAKAKK